jgi:hypothetical protein
MGVLAGGLGREVRGLPEGREKIAGLNGRLAAEVRQSLKEDE